MSKRDGLQMAFEANREQLLRYLRAHGAGDAAEDLLQELWLKAADGVTGPIASPLNYLYRAATNLMIDQRRSVTQRQRREQEWSGLTDTLAGLPANDPGPERGIDGRQRLDLVERELAKLPQRALSIFREHRLGGRTQREIALGRPPPPYSTGHVMPIIPLAASVLRQSLVKASASSRVECAQTLPAFRQMGGEELTHDGAKRLRLRGKGEVHQTATLLDTCVKFRFVVIDEQTAVQIAALLEGSSILAAHLLSDKVGLSIADVLDRQRADGEALGHVHREPAHSSACCAEHLPVERARLVGQPRRPVAATWAGSAAATRHRPRRSATPSARSGMRRPWPCRRWVRPR